MPDLSPQAAEARLWDAVFDLCREKSLGNAYKFSMQDGSAMSDEAFAAAGGNQSMAHVDFMIGSGEMDKVWP